MCEDKPASHVQQVCERLQDVFQILGESLHILVDFAHLQADLNRLPGSLLIDKETVAGITFLHFENRACQVAGQMSNGLLVPVSQILTFGVGCSLQQVLHDPQIGT